MSSKSSAKASPVKKTGPKKWRFTAIRFDAQFPGPICGIDEVGRAPLAGPVIAGAVFIEDGKLDQKVWKYVRDSKELSLDDREAMYDDIAANCHFGFGSVEPEEIDRINIHHASLLAMTRAYEAMRLKMAIFAGADILALVDGKFAPTINCRTQTVIKGDGQSLRIGAASILAKVYRDRLMTTLHREFPHYGWDTNAGYPTPYHQKAIREHGITVHHRKSFAPCRQMEMVLAG